MEEWLYYGRIPPCLPSSKYANNFIDTEVTKPDTPMWRLTGYYDRSRCKEAWDMIRNLSSRSSLPWCLMGDFNEILSFEDKKGGASSLHGL